jgi:hypothetical protein
MKYRACTFAPGCPGAWRSKSARVTHTGGAAKKGDGRDHQAVSTRNADRQPLLRGLSRRLLCVPKAEPLRATDERNTHRCSAVGADSAGQPSAFAYPTPAPPPANLVGDVRMFSTSTGWAQRLDDGALLHSIRGVQQWSVSSPPLPASQTITAVAYLSADDAARCPAARRETRRRSTPGQPTTAPPAGSGRKASRFTGSSRLTKAVLTSWTRSTAGCRSGQALRPGTLR